jgi:hypothetical protein
MQTLAIDRIAPPRRTAVAEPAPLPRRRDACETIHDTVPTLPPAERAALLTRLQAKVSADAFAALLAELRPLLPEPEWARLMSAIAPVPPAAR